MTGAPPVLDGKVIIGVSGGDVGIRGFLDAYDAKTGKRLWRLWTIPAPGEPGSETWGKDMSGTGGAATWGTGSYDPELNTLYRPESSISLDPAITASIYPGPKTSWKQV